MAACPTGASAVTTALTTATQARLAVFRITPASAAEARGGVVTRVTSIVMVIACPLAEYAVTSELAATARPAPPAIWITPARVMVAAAAVAEPVLPARSRAVSIA